MNALCLCLLLAAAPAPSQAEAPPGANRTAPVAVPAPSATAMAYYRSGNWLWAARQTMALAVPAFVLLSGLGVGMRKLAWRVGRKWFFAAAICFVLYALLDGVLHFPLAYFGGYVRQHTHGLSHQTFPRWLREELLDLGLRTALGATVIWFPYWLMRKSPRWWWLFTGFAALPVMFFVMFVEPIWIAPLYHRFGPMQDKKLEAEILDLASRAGIDGGRVFEVNISADTRAMNAYVTGFGASKRIVLWDTLLAKLDHAQVRTVMAHEMGHYVLHHVVMGLLAGFIGLLAALFLVDRMARAVLRRCGGQLGFKELHDLASLPLMILLLQAVVLVMMPAGLAFSRHLEHRADCFALDLTHDNRAMATAFVRMQGENLSNPRPGPLYMFLRATHPNTAQRIEFANEYKPWAK